MEERIDIIQGGKNAEAHEFSFGRVLLDVSITTNGNIQ